MKIPATLDLLMHSYPPSNLPTLLTSFCPKALRGCLFALAVPLLAAPCLRADDDADIRAMLADIDAKIVAHDVAGVLARYGTDFVNGGADYAEISLDLAENVPSVTSFHFSIAAINVQGEFATVTGTVDGSMDDGEIFTWQEPDAGNDGIGLGWLKKENGLWRVHGNQSRVGWYSVCTNNNASLRIAVESPFEIQSAIVSGPYISPTYLSPDSNYGGFKAFVTPSQRPAPGTEYTIDILFAGGERETVTDTIGAWIETAPDLTVTTVNGITTFSWNDVTAEVPNAWHYSLGVWGNGVEWRVDDIPLSQTLIVFNADGSASGTLNPGQTYTASITVFNETHDYAGRSLEFRVVSQFGDFTYADFGTYIEVTDYPSTAVGHVDIPGSINGKPVTSIGSSAFLDCSGLTSVTIPSSVTSIGQLAFSWCSGLVNASFMGNAPAMGGAVFDYAASGFTVYFFAGQAGFTSPLWNGYPAVSMGEPPLIENWLLENGLPLDADLRSDSNGDGVNLLLAYALDLDPNQNLAGRLPRPMLGPATLGITFHAAAPGITYTVQTSEDLETWTTDGVTLSALDPDGKRTATVDRSSPRRFLRLVVED